MTTDEKIRAAIKVECDRQHVGEDRQLMLWGAYITARDFCSKKIFKGDCLRSLAVHLEPSNGGQFRTTPVTFNGTVGGVSPDNIPRVIETWIDYFNSIHDWLKSEVIMVGEFSSEMIADADAIIKEFLDIHPFSDGNGRTAWLLRVWLLNKWDDPQPLPDYYGE